MDESQSKSQSQSQSIVTTHGSIVTDTIRHHMSKLWYGHNLDDDKKTPDRLPLIRRSNNKIKSSKQESQQHAFGTIETGDWNPNKQNPNQSSMATSSSFHFVNDQNEGDSRNVALGDGSATGNARNRMYASLDLSTNSSSKETLLSSQEALSDKDKASQSSWISLQKGRIILLLLGLVYGSLNISMRLVFARPDPPTASASSTIQGWFSVVCFLPLLWRNHHCNKNSNNGGWWGMPTTLGSRHLSGNNNNNDHHPRRSFWRFALELAFFNFGTQALINMSLVATQGARASFLVQMSVVFTPVVSVLLGQQKVSRRVWIACFVALAGLFVLSYSEEDNSNTESGGIAPSLTLSWGDWCCLLAALCWSLYIYRLSAWGEYFDETTTQFVKNIVLATLYTLWMLVSLASRYYYSGEASGEADESTSLWKGWRNDPVAWWILFYSALGPCTLADVFQQKAQSTVPAAETNVILSLEPVFTTLLGFLLLGEIPSLQELCGGLLIMIASVVVSCGPQPSAEAR